MGCHAGAWISQIADEVHRTPERVTITEVARVLGPGRSTAYELVRSVELAGLNLAVQ